MIYICQKENTREKIQQRQSTANFFVQRTASTFTSVRLTPGAEEDEPTRTMDRWIGAGINSQ